MLFSYFDTKLYSKVMLYDLNNSISLDRFLNLSKSLCFGRRVLTARFMPLRGA
jgi:hypothetical protein